MPRRAKTPRFEEYQSLSNTLDYFADGAKVKSTLDAGPYNLEIGCGRGEFCLELTRRQPKRKFVGIDIKSDRMWFGAKQARQLKLNNLYFLRANAGDLSDIFAPGSVDIIWLTFPDPYPKKRQAKHRLTHPNYLSVYQQLLSSGGKLRLKTDNRQLFVWSKEQVVEQPAWQLSTSGQDLHAKLPISSDWRVLTSYERRFIAKGQTINYLELTKL